MATTIKKQATKIASTPKVEVPKVARTTKRASIAARFVAYVEKKDEDHLIFAGFVVIIVALVIITAVRVINQPADDRTTLELPRYSRVLTSHDLGATDAYDVSVSSVGVSEANDPAFPLEQDETLLSMNFNITNRTTLKQEFIPTTQLFVRSREGTYYQMHPSVSIQDPISASSIEPGQTISGQISFAIPKRLSQPLLYIDTGWNDTTPLVYDVLR